MSNPTGWPQLGENRSSMHPEVTGWGDAPIDHANNNKTGTNGWGNPGSTTQSTGWGSPTGETGWGARTPSTVDNGTAVWGSSSTSRSQPVNNWGVPSSETRPQPPQQPPSGWNTEPKTLQQKNPTSADAVVNSNQTQPSNESLPPQTSANPTPNTWAQAAASGIPTTHNNAKTTESQPSNQISVNGDQDSSSSQNQSTEPTSNQTNEDLEDDPVQKYINSHEGWGKRPIQQNKSWNIEPMQSYPNSQPQVNTGTEAWGKPSSSSWDDGQGSQQQPWDKQQNWGVPQQQPSRPSWSGGQVNGQGWGDTQPNSMPPMPNMNSNPNRWGAGAPPGPSPGWGSNGPPKQSWGANEVSGTSTWDRSQSQMGGNGNSSNWVNPQQSNNQWKQQNMPNMGQPTVRPNVDDGTSAWGNPDTYKSVALWDKKGENEKGQGWGSGPQVNSSSPTGWGDAPTNKPNLDANNGTAVWGQNNSSKPGWNSNENTGWGSKPANSWGNNTEPSNQWGQNSGGNSGWDQPQNDIAAKDFGYNMDRKTSTGSDNVFEESGNHSMPLSGGSMSFGGNWGSGQFPGEPNMKMGMPRQGMPQNQMLNQTSPMMRGQTPQMLQPSQFHQIYNAVSKGLISPQMLTPQMMTPQHVNLLQQLIAEKTEFQKLSMQMQMFKQQQNLPPNLRQQQDHLARALQQLQQQIQVTQRAIHANMLLQSGKGLNTSSLGGMDMNMGQQGMGSFNMNSLMQNLPNQRPMNPNNSRESRLNSYKRPMGMDNQDPLMGMMGGPMGLNDLDQGNLGPSYLQNPAGGQYNMENNIPPNNQSGIPDIGPPEFTPGVPWKGLRPIDPENDPDMTPGSVANAKTMSINTVKDIDQGSSNQDSLTQSYGNPNNESISQANASHISNHPPTSLSHELWNVPLPQKPQQSSYNNRTAPGGPDHGRGWGSNSKAVWLVLNNISNQVDIGNLQALCAKHGSISSFQSHCPVPGMALVQYNSAEDAANARKELDMLPFGNSMIVANVNTDSEIENLIAGSMSGKWNQRPSGGTSGNYMVPPNPSNSSFGSGNDMQRLWGPNPPAMAPPTSWSNGNPLRGHVWSNDPDDSNRMLSSLLPDGLLGGETL